MGVVSGVVVEAVVSEMRDEAGGEVVGEVKDEVVGGVRDGVIGGLSDEVIREVSCCVLLLELQFCIVVGW